MKNVLKVIRTTVLECDTQTPVGRIYPLGLIKESIKTDKILQEKLSTHTLFGEIGWSIDDRTEVDLSKVAFSVDKLYWYKNKLKAVISILNTPTGRDLFKFYKTGKFAPLGVGETDLNNKVIEYQLCTIYFTW